MEGHLKLHVQFLYKIEKMQRKNVLYINYCAAVEDTRVRSKMHLDKTNPECYHHVYIFLTFFVNNAFEDLSKIAMLDF